MTTEEWSREQVLALPVVVDLVTAGSVFQIGRTAAYEQARTGTFPVPVLTVGCRYRVVTAHIVNLLGLDTTPSRPSTEVAA